MWVILRTRLLKIWRDSVRFPHIVTQNQNALDMNFVLAQLAKCVHFRYLIAHNFVQLLEVMTVMLII